MSFFYELCIGIYTYLYINNYLCILQIDLSKNTTFKGIVFCHNIGLSLFSGYIFYKGFLLMSTKTWYDIYGYSSQSLIDDPKFNKLIYYFYISKYYEFADTWISHLKRRDPGVFKVYHHIGAVVSMGMGYYFHVQPTWLFLMFNSFVHTIMYIYYALTTLKFKIYCKNLLTSIQIAQLVSGVSIAWYYILFTKMTLIQRIGCLIDMIYLKGLIYLFINFYNKAYKLKDNVIEQKQ